MRKSTADIYQALQTGTDDTAVNEIIRDMLSTDRTTATDHDVMVWRRDNYQDLRRWAYPSTESYLRAIQKHDAGGTLAVEGQLLLREWSEKTLAVDLRFPPNPYVPDPPDPPDAPPE